ncbi:hypothetical protein [Glaciibacter psychrotolerans]|uniref:Uncharacterized protein n=1 Tax=Glaciibacter psychrotolerans TaxID=670054 RepID=A0A7Z0J4M6_9MICO|nr:hypothetical protein [Leifsonia psychrotolerans]NYJ18500.1 hypothetical protein [Leifsonia psychrotolerans]
MNDTVHLLTELLAVAGDGVEGAPRTVLREFVAVQQHAEFLGAVVMQSKIDMERSIRAVADLVNGIITLFECGGSSVVSAMVLVRSAGESIMRFCHIHDPNVPPAQTLLRMAAYQIESVEDGLRTAEAFGTHGEEDARDAREKITIMHENFTSNGIELLASQRRPEFTVNLSLDGVTENVNVNLTDAYRRYLQVGSWDWALGSGATHGRGWFLPNIVGTFDEAPLMNRKEVAITVMLQILEVATALAVAAGGHTGTDTNEYQRKVHQRRIGATAVDREQPGHAVGHREYGRRQVAPSFPLGTNGESFAVRP